MHGNMQTHFVPITFLLFVDCGYHLMPVEHLCSLFQEITLFTLCSCCRFSHTNRYQYFNTEMVYWHVALVWKNLGKASVMIILKDDFSAAVLIRLSPELTLNGIVFAHITASRSSEMMEARTLICTRKSCNYYNCTQIEGFSSWQHISWQCIEYTDSVLCHSQAPEMMKAATR